jgi:hypothetical protein
MRRLLLSLVAVCFLGALGCSHTVGICDCDPNSPCGPFCPGACHFEAAPAPAHALPNHHSAAPQAEEKKL